MIIIFKVGIKKGDNIYTKTITEYLLKTTRVFEDNWGSLFTKKTVARIYAKV